MAERTTKPCRCWFGQCFDTTVGEYRSIPFRDLLHQRHDSGHLMREIKQLREVHAVQNKSGVLDTPIAADQKAITPVPLHCREIEARQQRRTTILPYVPLPQAYRALDVAPLIRPSLRCTNRAMLGRLLPFQHGQPLARAAFESFVGSGFSAHGSARWRDCLLAARRHRCRPRARTSTAPMRNSCIPHCWRRTEASWTNAATAVPAVAGDRDSQGQGVGYNRVLSRSA